MPEIRIFIQVKKGLDLYRRTDEQVPVQVYKMSNNAPMNPPY